SAGSRPATSAETVLVTATRVTCWRARPARAQAAARRCSTDARLAARMSRTVVVMAWFLVSVVDQAQDSSPARWREGEQICSLRTGLIQREVFLPTAPTASGFIIPRKDSLMADIRAFRAYRYDLGRVGALSDVVPPPYDVIDPALQH